MILIVDDPRVRRHLAMAVGSHCDRLRHNGVPVPPDLLYLSRTLAARSGQERPKVAGPSSEAQPDGMALTLTYKEAAHLLRASGRTVQRLVSLGDLTAVTLGTGSRRIRVSDLRDYVRGLTPSASSGVEESMSPDPPGFASGGVDRPEASS